MIDKLQAIKERYHYLLERMSDPEVSSNQKEFIKISKEYKSLEPVVHKGDEYQNVMANIDNAKKMLKDTDPEMKEMANIELDELNPQRDTLLEEIKVLLIPKDPEDSMDVIFEIRSGAGGDEASIFVGDLLKMYSKYFENQGWKVEVIDESENSVGGFNKIILEVSGQDVYGKLKFESGAHRVQRVPKTESQGRVHTSAATVAVIPQYEEEDIDINKADLRTDTFRASGAGGQHVNKTESGVRFTHIPTGIAAESTESRSQIKNRGIAMTRLYQKIKEVTQAKIHQEQKNQRQSLVGSGDRSDKIRTYNYPQNRLTDHRINLTLYSLDKVVQGQIDEIIDALVVFENAEKMKLGS
ncbi:MAG: peptide chain release factor 1 [Saprospiraceae bacterium]|jgi:peptide chain release factor 1